MEFQTGEPEVQESAFKTFKAQLLNQKSQLEAAGKLWGELETKMEESPATPAQFFTLIRLYKTCIVQLQQACTATEALYTVLQQQLADSSGVAQLNTDIHTAQTTLANILAQIGDKP